MGMGQRKLHARVHRQRTEITLDQQINTPDLYSEKPVESDLTVECFRDPEDAPVKIGSKARLVDMRSRIDVFIGFTSVGYVVSNQSEVLRARLKLGQTPGQAIKGVVVEVSTLTPTFIVSLKK